MKQKQKNFFSAAWLVLAAAALLAFSACPQPTDSGSPGKPVVTWAVTVNASDNGLVTADVEKAAKDAVVTLTITPETDFELAALVVQGASGRIAVSGDSLSWTFVMPAEAVTVSASFVSSLAQKYAITITGPITNGSVTASHVTAAEGTEIFITPAADDGYEVAWLHIEKADSAVIDPDEFGALYSFTMPGQAVHIDAAFVLAGQQQRNINIGTFQNGTVESRFSKAAEGVEITLTVTPAPGYRLDTLAVNRPVGPGGGGPVTVTDTGNNRFTFIMPSQNVTVVATFAALTLRTITITPSENGELTSNPATETYETGTVTITAIPATGFRYRPSTLEISGASGPVSYAEVVDADNQWTFVMPAEDVTINAAFIDENTPVYDVTLVQAANGAIGTVARNAVAGDTVTVTLTPTTGDYRVQGGFPVIIGADSSPVTSSAAGTNQWTFTMPAQAVTVSAVFELIPTYLITSAQIANGTISTSPSGYVRAGTTVTATLTIDDTDVYRYQTGSFSVTRTTLGALTATPGEGLSWTFTMPAEADAEAVTVSAVVEAIPLYNLTLMVSGESTQASWSASPLVSGQAREGKTITLTLTITSAEDYRIDPNNGLTLGGITAGDLTAVPGQTGQWTLVMPANAVSVDAKIALIPYTTITKGTETNGTFTVSAEQTRPGRSITVTASPNKGYKVDEAPYAVLASDGTTSAGLTFSPVAGTSNQWTFVMGEDDITVKVDFVWTHEFEFYKGSEGGLRTGVTQNVLWPYYNTTVITYEGAGRTGGNAIKVAAGEKQVGLVSSQPINLEGVYALSFWAKTSGAVPVEFACFGSNIGEGLTYQNLVMYGNVTYQGDTFTINSTDWKHYMIPVPVQKPGAVADRFILKTNGSGNDLYLDDIEFLIDEEAIECTSIDIPLTYNREFMYPGPTSAESIFNTMQYTAEYTFDTDVTTTLKNMIAIPALALTFRFSDWGGLDYAVDGAASISDGQITTASLGGAFNLYLKIGETISTAMACTTLSSNKVIIEDFEECVTGNFGSNNTLGYREWGTWTGVNNTGNLFISGLSGRIYNSNNGKSGRHFASSIDISSCTNISLKVKSLVALQDGDSYTLELRNGSEGEGTWYSSNFTIDVANMVETKILAISSFVGLDTSAITGWRVGIVGTPTARDIVVDDIEAE